MRSPVIGRWVSSRFATQEIADEDGRVVAHDLLFRWNAATPPGMLAPGELFAASVLSNGLLDGVVAGQTPAGRLFVVMDEPTLVRPLAELVTATVGAIDLSDAVAVDTSLLMRVAERRARGLRFRIDDLQDLDDPRWLLTHYADCIKLDLASTWSDWDAPIVDKAGGAGLEVIGKRVESMVGYRRLAELGVGMFQGRFISPPIDTAVAALPGCDDAVLHRIQRLLADRASAEAIAASASADPALVMRLLILHRLRGSTTAREPQSLVAMLSAFPSTRLSGWMRTLLQTCCHGYGQRWTSRVRAEIDRCRRRQAVDPVRAKTAAGLSGAREFQRRLCSPRHYLKTLRHGV